MMIEVKQECVHFLGLFFTAFANSTASHCKRQQQTRCYACLSIETER